MSHIFRKSELLTKYPNKGKLIPVPWWKTGNACQEGGTGPAFSFGTRWGKKKKQTEISSQNFAFYYLKLEKAPWVTMIRCKSNTGLAQLSKTWGEVGQVLILYIPFLPKPPGKGQANPQPLDRGADWAGEMFKLKFTTFHIDICGGGCPPTALCTKQGFIFHLHF